MEPTEESSVQTFRRILGKKWVHCSGKTFLLGEYAVLLGLPALVAATGPRFRARFVEQIGQWPFDPESPAGRWIQTLASHDLELPVCEWIDPFGGRGGLGASSAQFLLLYRASCVHPRAKELGFLPDWKTALAHYRQIVMPQFEDCRIQPSGADVVAQARGGVILYDPAQGTARQIPTDDEVAEIMIFSATSIPGRKVATHTHLKSLEDRTDLDAFHRLEKLVGDGAAAFEKRDFLKFGQICTQYAVQLQKLGLEHSGTTEDREALSRMAGVWGAKGCGAMGADSVLVVVDTNLAIPARASIIQVALSRGLQLVTDGMNSVPGLELTVG